jgi:hypothetical protein
MLDLSVAVTLLPNVIKVAKIAGQSGPNSSREWLAALLTVALLEIHTGIENPTNSTDCLRMILVSCKKTPEIEGAGRVAAFSAQEPTEVIFRFCRLNDRY